MSVNPPAAAVVFGSVTPPQSDVIDVRVHLGCSSEVSSFECLLQNWDKKYGPGGTAPINVGDIARIDIGRGATIPQILTGKVEEIEPLSTATEHYIRVKGRCDGEQLFRRLVTKTWDNVKGEVVVKYLIDNYTSLSHVRDSVELVEDTDTTYTHLEYEDTPVFDILKYIAETVDKAGVIGFDFRIAPDGKFEFFPKNSKSSSVSLSECLEVSEYAKNIHRVKNKITIRGFAGKVEPSNIDAWTETLDNWSTDSGYGTMALDDWYPRWGTYFVKCYRPGETTGTVMFKRTFGQVAKPQTLRVWLNASNNTFNAADSWIRLLAPDENNYFELIGSDWPVFPPALIGSWSLEEIALGKENTYNAQTNPNGKWVKVGSPSWADIQGIKFRLTSTGGLGQVAMGVDGLHFDKIRYSAVKENSASQTQYGLREKVETDEELRSDAECEYRAKALLDFLKGPIETLKVRSEVIDYGTTPILAGDKIHVTIPNENIDADYRVISIKYKASGREQTLEVELELGKEPLLLADFIYGFRKSIQKLDKYKPSDVAHGVASGGGGGGGISQHGNEYHDPDMALQSDFASHKDRHKAGGDDAFAVADLLDAVARVKVRKNSGSDVGVRRRLNLIEGSNVTLTIADDPTDEEVDVTIASTGGGLTIHDGAYHERDLVLQVASDPGSPINGDMWFNTTDGWIKIRVGGVTRRLCHWDDIYSKPSTFPPSSHDHLNDHLRPTYLGKTPAAGGTSELLLWCEDAAAEYAHNSFAPQYSGYGRIGTSSRYWNYRYFYNLRVNTLFYVGSIRGVSGDTHYFPDVASVHSTLRPTTANYSYLGTSTYYWNSLYAYNVRYKSLAAFDALDDIGLLRRIKAHPLNKDAKGLPEVDWSTVPDEIKAYESEDHIDNEGVLQQPEGSHDFVDAGALTGLLIGAVKQLADKVDELKARISTLEQKKA